MKRRKTLKEQIISFIVFAFITVFIVFLIFPIYWMIITSFKTPSDAMSSTPKIIPFVDFIPSLKTWSETIFGYKYDDTIKAIINSIVIASASATLSVFLGSLAGYALSRFRYYKWKNRDIMGFIIAQRMLPPIVALVPLYYIFSQLNLLDTQLAIILIHTAFNTPLTVWILKDFFDSLPIEIEEAALIDGAKYDVLLSKIVLPLVMPGLVATWILSFILSWNEFLMVLGLAYNNAITLTWLVSTGHHVRALEWWTISAYGTLAIVPPILFVAILQRYVIKGLTFGAVRR